MDLPGPASLADNSNVGDRLRRIQPYELLIFITLAILMALCLVVAETVIVTDRPSVKTNNMFGGVPNESS